MPTRRSIFFAIDFLADLIAILCLLGLTSHERTPGAFRVTGLALIGLLAFGAALLGTEAIVWRATPN